MIVPESALLPFRGKIEFKDRAMDRNRGLEIPRSLRHIAGQLNLGLASDDATRIGPRRSHDLGTLIDVKHATLFTALLADLVVLHYVLMAIRANAPGMKRQQLSASTRPRHQLRIFAALRAEQLDHFPAAQPGLTVRLNSH